MEEDRQVPFVMASGRAEACLLSAVPSAGPSAGEPPQPQLQVEFPVLPSAVFASPFC